MEKRIQKLTLFIFFTGIMLLDANSHAAFKIFNSDDSKFEKSHIIEILSKETLLFYSDGQTQLGSLFGQEHRIYITIDRVPRNLKDAIVSAEDETFYTNVGVDPKGIARAAIHNLFSRSRQGASTITQQTVKNLYGRKETDLKTKFEEMINAFKLERRYSKDQILEFYLNQFHVTGNGRGIGVAAKYYFNKEVEELTLNEAAFIAGSVKGPDKYNPFTKTTVTGQQKAKQDAFIRKNYVLERMYKTGKITKQVYEKTLKEQVPFNQGKFQFNELATNQIVLKQLNKPDILSAIGATNIDDVGTMGLHITTTIDKDTQAAAQYGLRQNLSRMQTILSGFKLETSSSFANIQKPELYNFYTGKIDSLVSTDGKEEIKINLGIPFCTADREAINRIATIADQVNHAGIQKSKKTLLSSLHPNDFILISIKKITPQGQIFCDLENRPKIQGAALVLDKGQIVAMSGGFSSNEYNRAIFAERQPGSTFKIPTYYAALQLGWSVLDPLSNLRDVFPWQKNLYFPRPDHAPSTLETTILGAGAKSENLASIWLMAHLLDKLNYNQFEDLLKFLEILKPSDSPQQTASLIVNKFNARINDEIAIKRGILEQIKSEMLNDINISKNDQLRVFLRTLHYEDLSQNSLPASDSSLTKKELELRENIFKNHLSRWNLIAQQARSAIAELQKIQKSAGMFVLNKEFSRSFARTENGDLAFYSNAPWSANGTTPLVPDLKSNPLSTENLIHLLSKDPSLFQANQILLDGIVPIGLLNDINSMVQDRYNSIMKQSDLEKLFWNADFRYSLGMLYTANMVKQMGVSEPIQWVPSFPLGSNSITLANLSLLYQTFLTGKTYRYFNTDQKNQLLVIKRIEDSNGNLLWESKSTEYQLIDPFYSNPLLNTLRGTVTAGTAFPLNWSIVLRSNNDGIDQQLKTLKIRVPIFGKTGTTNNYINGTFIGFLPYPSDSSHSLSSENAYTIASYIGYDSNKPMVNRWYRAYGGAAIPAWEEIALSIVKNQNFAAKLDWNSLSQNPDHVVPFDYGDNVVKAFVPLHSGIPVSIQDQNNQTTANDDPYADDYSDTKENLLEIYLAGSVSNDILVPKRKVSFYQSNQIDIQQNQKTDSEQENSLQNPETQETIPTPPNLDNH